MKSWAENSMEAQNKKPHFIIEVIKNERSNFISTRKRNRD